jgi:hypothetical protein
MLLATEIKVPHNIKDYQLSFDKGKVQYHSPLPLAPLPAIPTDGLYIEPPQ